jgi:hypothetical protein
VRAAATGAFLVGILVLAQVVAAGVYAVLGPLALEAEEGPAQIAGLVLVSALAVSCALAFLKGSLRLATDQLQCRTGRRGG